MGSGVEDTLRRVGSKTRESGEMESYCEIIINEIMSE